MDQKKIRRKQLCYLKHCGRRYGDINKEGFMSVHLENMQTDGVCVFTNKISIYLNDLKTEINKIKSIVVQKVNTMERPLKTYSDIAERHLGRLDYRCGFNADIFKQAEKPITALI